MRKRSPANSAASSPPVPARISRMALFSSAASFGSSSSRTSRSSSGSAPASPAAPPRRASRISGSAAGSREHWPRSRSASRRTPAADACDRAGSSSANSRARPLSSPGARSQQRLQLVAGGRGSLEPLVRAARPPPSVQPPATAATRARDLLLGAAVEVAQLRRRRGPARRRRARRATRAPSRSARFIRWPGLPRKASSTATPARRSAWASAQAAASAAAPIGTMATGRSAGGCRPAACASRSTPAAQPTPGTSGPPIVAHQAVIAAAGHHRALGAQRRGRELEGGVGVVVEAADQPRVHRGRRCPAAPGPPARGRRRRGSPR